MTRFNLFIFVINVFNITVIVTFLAYFLVLGLLVSYGAGGLLNSTTM